MDKVDWEMVNLIAGLIGTSAILAGLITLIVKIATPIVKFLRYMDAL